METRMVTQGGAGTTLMMDHHTESYAGGGRAEFSDNRDYDNSVMNDINILSRD